MPLSNLAHLRFADVVFGDIVSMSHPSKSRCGPGSDCTKLVAKRSDRSTYILYFPVMILATSLGETEENPRPSECSFSVKMLTFWPGNIDETSECFDNKMFWRCKIWSFHHRVQGSCLHFLASHWTVLQEKSDWCGAVVVVFFIEVTIITRLAYPLFPVGQLTISWGHLTCLYPFIWGNHKPQQCRFLPFFVDFYIGRCCYKRCYGWQHREE